jgi:two-component system NarL family response regulator
MSIRVLLSSKHQVISEGIAAILRTHSDMNVVGVSNNGQQTHALCNTEDPDVVLIGTQANDAQGLQLMQQMAHEQPSRCVVAFPAIRTGTRSWKFWTQVPKRTCRPPAASTN